MGQNLMLCVHLSINFEPNIPLGTALYDGTNRHETDDKGLALFDRDVHFFASFWSAKEVPGGDDAIVDPRLAFKFDQL